MKKILVAASVAMLWVSGAWALGTTAGTTVDNSATLSFSAGGVAQPDVTSTTDTFVVDKKIDLILETDDSDQIEVTPGQTDRITSYTFKNEGNADQNFSFTAYNLAQGEEADYDNDQDNGTDVKNIEIYCNYIKPDGTAATAGWNSTFIIEVKADTSADCQVRADIETAANGAADGDIMNIELNATAVDANGNKEVETTTVDTQNSVDIVFADGESVQNSATSGLGDTATDDNSTKGDTAGDGIDVARSGYIISTPVLSATKTSCVVSDPVNNTTNPKRIPGAVIRYMFDIKNTGSAAVSDLNVTDTFSTNFTDGTNIQISNVFKNENQTSCSCTSPGNTNATHSESGMTTTIQGISVAAPSGGNESHSCVSVEVEIK